MPPLTGLCGFLGDAMLQRCRAYGAEESAAQRTEKMAGRDDEELPADDFAGCLHVKRLIILCSLNLFGQKHDDRTSRRERTGLETRVVPIVTGRETKKDRDQSGQEEDQSQAAKLRRKHIRLHK
jgi:hypothetical protein